MGTKRILAVVIVGVVLLASGCVLRVEDPGGDYSQAKGINEHGVIIGDSGKTDASRRTHQHGYKRLPDGTVIDLATWPGAGDVWAQDINDAGVVVGFMSEGASGIGHAVRWDASGAISDVGVPGMPSRAYAINEAGIIGGDAWDGTRNVPFVFDPAVGHGVVLPSLPGIGNSGGIKHLTDSGKAIGQVGSTSLLWDLETGTVTDLEQLTGLSSVQFLTEDGTMVGTDATGIVIVPAGSTTPVHAFDTVGRIIDVNDNLMMIGSVYQYPASPANRAFTWSPDAGFAWISSPHNWTQATALNDRGQIVGDIGTNSLDCRTALLFADPPA